jgi:hypothetical protein
MVARSQDGIVDTAEEEDRETDDEPDCPKQKK